MTAFRFHPEPREIANVRFVDGSGAARSLSDWKGKVVLLNLWATWCAPCRKEMPALDRLQKALGSDVFEVVPLNLDRGGVETAKKFLDQIKNEALKLYADPSTRASTELNAVGMPTTILIDRDGRELGRIVGPAEWDGAGAQRLIAAFCASGARGHRNYQPGRALAEMSYPTTRGSLPMSVKLKPLHRQIIVIIERNRPRHGLPGREGRRPGRAGLAQRGGAPAGRQGDHRAGRRGHPHRGGCRQPRGSAEGRRRDGRPLRPLRHVGQQRRRLDLGRLEEVSDEDHRRLFDTNFWGSSTAR